jgi:hypothetical protein
MDVVLQLATWVEDLSIHAPLHNSVGLTQEVAQPLVVQIWFVDVQFVPALDSLHLQYKLLLFGSTQANVELPVLQ